MEYFWVALVASSASLLTFFSGFGLGTILTPFFILFFPPTIAVSLTGIVHLLNNLFKIVLTYKSINRATVLKFGIPSIIGALLGSFILLKISGLDLTSNYTIVGFNAVFHPVKFTIGVLILIFTIIEMLPSVKNFRMNATRFFAGGILSGFFGGLSGHQGALRSMFLVKSDLSKESFIASGIAIACLVDLTRLPIYFNFGSYDHVVDNYQLLGVAVLSAFLGAYVGNKLMKKTTYSSIKYTVSVCLILLSLLLTLGVI